MRPSLVKYWCDMLPLVAARGTCARRKVGCIITDERGKIISTGYNGVAPGMSHCIDSPCPGALDKSGDNTKCEATHAEQNALLWAGPALSRAKVLYCSCTPCFNCAKLIVITDISKVYVLEEYPGDTRGLELLKHNGVSVMRYTGVDDYGVDSLLEL